MNTIENTYKLNFINYNNSDIVHSVCKIKL